MSASRYLLPIAGSPVSDAIASASVRRDAGAFLATGGGYRSGAFEPGYATPQP